MNLYIDSANFDEVTAAMSMGATGITTTPSLMLKHGVADVNAAIKALLPLGELHVEALGDTKDEIIREANRLRTLFSFSFPPNLVFKIPATTEGVKACYALSANGCRVNMHLVYTPQQALMAKLAGAEFVCLLAGRLQDHFKPQLATTGVYHVEAYKQRFKEILEVLKGSTVKTMFSSVRSTQHVIDAQVMDFDAITVPFNILQSMMESELTRAGVETLKKDTAALKVQA